jgi:hypothetical protein
VGYSTFRRARRVFPVVAIGAADRHASQAEIVDDQLEWQRIYIGGLFCCMAHREICPPRIKTAR